MGAIVFSEAAEMFNRFGIATAVLVMTLKRKTQADIVIDRLAKVQLRVVLRKIEHFPRPVLLFFRGFRSGLHFEKNRPGNRQGKVFETSVTRNRHTALEEEVYADVAAAFLDSAEDLDIRIKDFRVTKTCKELFANPSAEIAFAGRQSIQSHK